MGLNIKNEETCRLVQELAQLTGESLTAAVTDAVKEKLSKCAIVRETKPVLERMMEIARDPRRALKSRGSRLTMANSSMTRKACQEVIVDSSAWVAILRGEPEGVEFLASDR